MRQRTGMRFDACPKRYLQIRGTFQLVVRIIETMEQQHAVMRVQSATCWYVQSAYQNVGGEPTVNMSSIRLTPRNLAPSLKLHVLKTKAPDACVLIPKKVNPKPTTPPKNLFQEP